MGSSQTNSSLVLIARATWMMFGPAALFVTAAVIVTSPGRGWWTVASIIYLVALVATALSRWLEFASGVPLDSMGNRVTIHDLQRFTVITLLGGGVAWVLVNFVSNHLMA